MAISMVSGIIMVPLYLKFIPVDVYGAWLASGNILAWLAIVDPGLTTVLQQRIGMAYGRKDYQGIREFLGGGLVISVGVMCLVIVLGLIFAHYLPLLLHLPPSIDAHVIVQAFSLTVIGTSMSLFSFSINSINQGLQGSLGIGFIYITGNILALILSVILLYKGFGLITMGITSIFVGIFYLLGQCTYLFWRLIDDKIGFRISFNNITALAKFLFYTFISRSAGIIANNIDLLFVSQFLGPSTVAVLSLTRKTPDLVKELANQPSSAFFPAIAHLAGEGEGDKAKDIITRLIRILFWLISLIVGGFISLNSDFIRLWVGSYLFAGQTINIVVCVTIFFTLIVSCLSNICLALGDIKKSSLVGFVQSLLFIPLVIFGTKYFGLIGTVLAPLISVLVGSSWYFPISLSKLLKLSSKDKKTLIYECLTTVIVMVILILGFSWVYPKNWFQFIFVVVFFCFLYGLFIYLFSKAFRTEVKNIIYKFIEKIS